MKHTALFLSVLLSFFACQTEKKGYSDEVLEGTVDGIRVAWDYSSMQQIAEQGAYSRLLRMQDNSLIAVYDTRTGDVDLRRSYDEGATWSEPVTIFPKFTYKGKGGASTLVNIANAEITQLKNGDIIVGCNYRPTTPEIAPFSIAIRRSTDNGATWLPTQVLYDAAPRFHDGCWEPSFLQLPDGEVQIYFANENPYQESGEQEISLLRSKDNGATWSDASMVCFRKDRRDGMPVARILGDEIVVVIEDNNVDKFKPYTVRTKLEGNWSKPVLADSPDREYALTEKMNDTIYMGAPYLLKLPTGETMISYQTNEGRPSDWEYSTMEVAIGDKQGRHFSKRTRPFDVPMDKEAKWNSLAVWDEGTVVAFGGSNFKSKEIAPWIIKGYIIPELKIASKDITAFPLFIGSKGKANLRGGLGADNKNLYIKCKVADDDNTLYNSGNSACDGVYTYIYNGKESIRIWCSYEGKIEISKLKDGTWQTLSATGVEAIASIKDNGYELDITIPKEEINIAGKNEMRLSMALASYNGAQNGYVEMLVNSEENKPGSWLKIALGD